MGTMTSGYRQWDKYSRQRQLAIYNERLPYRTYLKAMRSCVCLSAMIDYGGPSPDLRPCLFPAQPGSEAEYPSWVSQSSSKADKSNRSAQPCSPGQASPGREEFVAVPCAIPYGTVHVQSYVGCFMLLPPSCQRVYQAHLSLYQSKSLKAQPPRPTLASLVPPGCEYIKRSTWKSTCLSFFDINWALNSATTSCQWPLILGIRLGIYLLAPLPGYRWQQPGQHHQRTK